MGLDNKQCECLDENTIFMPCSNRKVKTATIIE